MPSIRPTPGLRTSDSREIQLFNAGFKAGKGKSTSVLIKRSRGFGDVLMVLPALKALKRKYGSETKIIFETSPAYFPLLRRFSFIELTEEKQRRSRKQYGLIVDLQNKVDFLPVCRSGPRQDLFAELLEVSPRCYRSRFNFPVSKREIERAKAILERSHWRGEKLLGLHLMAYSTIRTWPIERNLELVERLHGKEGWKILILESHAVREQFRKFDHIILPDRTGLVDLLGLLSLCECIVCPDSGVMHLAGFLQIPTVALFGPIRPEFRIGYYPKTRAIYLGLDCQPCEDWQIHACYKRPHYRQCLKGITVEMVIRDLEEIGCF